MLALLAFIGIAATKGAEENVSVVNLAKDGDYFQCNTNPSFFISDLSDSDKEKVYQLEFVQALFRHGTRILQNFPDEFFPEYAENNPDWKIECNITAIDGRQYGETNENLKFRRKFVENEQFYKNSNCSYEQSLFGMISQMEEISDIFKQRYFGNKDEYKIFDANDLQPENLQIYSTDTSRTIDSALYFTQSLLETDNYQQPLTMDLMIHDEINEPFRYDLNRKCNSESQWIEWNERFEDAVNNQQALEEFENSAFAQDVKERYLDSGGVWLPNRGSATFFGLAYHFCAGLDIPVSLDLWQDMEEYDILFQKEQWDQTEYGEEMNYCQNHIRSIPAYHVLLDAINGMKENNGPKALIISSHGVGMVPYLQGLNMYNKVFPKIANLLTLEIYSSSSNNNDDDNIEYYFRWTQDGEFVPYHVCQDYYNRENTELCDLQIMLDQDFNDVVPINEFSENICSHAVDLCLCGLCDDE